MAKKYHFTFTRLILGIAGGEDVRGLSGGEERGGDPPAPALGAGLGLGTGGGLAGA